MIKKYLPLFVLLIAALAIWYIKSHQRGHYYVNPSTEQQGRSDMNDTISAVTNTDNSTGDDFNRAANKIIYSRHARCRMECRHIDENEIKEILKDGKVNEHKIESDDRGKTYPLEGIAEGHHLRIVFAPKDNNAVEVVTCIDLDTDWPCDCQ